MHVKKQLPFDSALLTRFHLIFLIRKPDLNKFVKITRSIVDSKKSKVKDGDISFLKDYINYALKGDVKIPENLKEQIVDFSRSIKKSEDMAEWYQQYRDTCS